MKIITKFFCFLQIILNLHSKTNAKRLHRSAKLWVEDRSIYTLLLISGLILFITIEENKHANEEQSHLEKKNKMDTDRPIQNNGLKIQYCNGQTRGRG